MNTPSRMFQRIGGLGIVYSVLFAAGLFLSGNEPGTSAGGAAVVRYYHSHRVAELASVFLIMAAAVVFTFFLVSLGRTLGRTTEGRQLAPIIMAGGAVYVGGLLLMGALTMALVDSGHYRMGAAAQTLNVLSSDDWVPAVVGLSILALGTGVTALRAGALPRWLAWASVGLGVLAVAGPLGAVAFIITPLWTLAVGIVLLRASAVDRSAETPETAAPAFTRANS